jgi:hypothetical protein
MWTIETNKPIDSELVHDALCEMLPYAYGHELHCEARPGCRCNIYVDESWEDDGFNMAAEWRIEQMEKLLSGMTDQKITVRIVKR